MRNQKYAAFSGAEPYFNLVRRALGDLVDGDHFFDIVTDNVVYEVLYADITSAQLAPVKPDLNAGRAKRLANSPPRLSILCGVAQEYGSGWWTRLYRRPRLHARSLNSVSSPCASMP